MERVQTGTTGWLELGARVGLDLDNMGEEEEEEGMGRPTKDRTPLFRKIAHTRPKKWREAVVCPSYAATREREGGNDSDGLWGL